MEYSLKDLPDLKTLKGIQFDIIYFAFIVLVSGFVGIMVGYAFDDNFLVAMIAGYAGGDFLDNVYKLVAKKSKAINLPD